LIGTAVAATVILPAAGLSAGAGVAAGLTHTGAAATGGSTAGAVAAAAGTGAMTGAAAGAAIGAGVGGAASAGVAATSAGSAGVTAAGLVSGPVGWMVLGASEEPTTPTTSAYTFDCWKQVVHDTSPEPSSGRLLREIVVDPRVKQVTTSDDSLFPEIVLENVLGEKFRIEYVRLLPSDQWAAHAVLLGP